MLEACLSEVLAETGELLGLKRRLEERASKVAAKQGVNTSRAQVSRAGEGGSGGA